MENLSTGIHVIGSTYIYANSDGINYWYRTEYDGYSGWVSADDYHPKYGCWGIRPVVELNEGIYIARGTGVEGDPYILEKD